MSQYCIGLDFGTNSCRALLVDINDGSELGTSVFQYPSGEAGVILEARDPLLARQNPNDYILGIEESVRGALRQAALERDSFDPMEVIGIGVDTTGSSPLPIDESGEPLCYQDQFSDNPGAMVWLWKDHTSHAEAEEITRQAAALRPEYLAKIGGVYSSEWFWAKILNCRRHYPEVFQSAHSFAEICDWIPAVLTGITQADKIQVGICAAGHKALYNESWGGLPDVEFLSSLDPALGEMRSRLYDSAYSAERKIGTLSPEWAAKLGLSESVSIAVGAFDAHMGAVGAGVRRGTLVKIMGTSTCDILVWPAQEELADIPGVCGIVNGSVLEGYYGIEAGQSAVGDIFLWFVNHLVPEKYGSTQEQKFRTLGDEAASLKPGESGLLALDWNNGNRTILVDVRLSGLLIGQTLHTTPHEIYRALIEATAFGALAIIDRVEENGIRIDEVVNCGGLAMKNELLMQIYADVTGRPMMISRSQQTPALGAAIFAAVASGGHSRITAAQDAMTATSRTYQPDGSNHATYSEIYTLYKQLHDSFGTREYTENLYHVMKTLLDIKDRIRGGE